MYESSEKVIYLGTGRCLKVAKGIQLFIQKMCYFSDMTKYQICVYYWNKTMNSFCCFDTSTFSKTSLLCCTGQCLKLAKMSFYPGTGQCVKVAKSIKHFIRKISYFSDLSKCQSSVKENTIFPYFYATLTLWHVRKLNDN